MSRMTGGVALVAVLFAVLAALATGSLREQCRELQQAIRKRGDLLEQWLKPEDRVGESDPVPPAGHVPPARADAERRVNIALDPVPPAWARTAAAETERPASTVTAMALRAVIQPELVSTTTIPETFDLLGWIRFGGSLRIRLGLRVQIAGRRLTSGWLEDGGEFRGVEVRHIGSGRVILARGPVEWSVPLSARSGP